MTRGGGQDIDTDGNRSEEAAAADSVTADADEHALGMNPPSEAEERAYNRRLTWGWRLVAIGIVTALAAVAFVELDSVPNHVLYACLVAPLPVGLCLNGSAMVQFPRQTLGRFGPWFSTRHSPEPDPIETKAGGIVFGLVWIAAGLAIAALALDVVL